MTSDKTEMPENIEEKPIPQVEIPYLNEWNDLQCKPIYQDSEWCMRREVIYPLTHKHGRNSFSELSSIINIWNERKLQHPLSAFSKQSQDFLFFDTETTGLGGGVGNTIFLLGYGQCKKDHFSVTQLFLPSPSSELSFYTHFLQDIKGHTQLVTYNGKSFDWPQVKTRHTLHRKELETLPNLDHHDLLHASRRLWKNQLPSCRLATIEEQILDFHRVDDTPGYMAPILYFEYLNTKDPRTLSGVFYHNEWDICSLVSLYVHLSKMLLNENLDSTLCNSKEYLEIGRWFEAIGETQLAKLYYRNSIEKGNGQEQEAKHLLALLYKKSKEYHHAKTLWESISEKNDYSIDTNIELAKLYEHVYRDYEKALYYTENAQHNWLRTRKRGSHIFYSKMKIDLNTRITRLKKKIEGNRIMSEEEQGHSLFDLPNTPI